MEDNKYLIKFKKPYTFEQEEYNEVDLSKIEELAVKDLAEADKIFLNSGNRAVVNEMSVAYACIIASKVTKKPVEFFEGLPANEGVKMKNVVTNFFYGED